MTSKQRAYLRGLANDYRAIFQIGKNEISDNFIKQIDDALEARELIKVHVLENSGLTAKEACAAVCEETGAEPVSTVGNKFVIYRESKNNKVIEL